MNVENKSPLKPGEARCPGPSAADIIRQDVRRAPEELLVSAYEFMGDADIPIERYTSRVFFNLEMEKMWPKVWQWACREEHIPDVGDHYVYDIGDHSILVVRTADDEIKAYRNSCLHRGVQLKPSGACGASPNLRCPYHGFTWSLEGDLVEIPCQWDFPHIDKQDFKLPEVRAESWGGFVFINLDPHAKPLEDYLGALKDHFKKWPLEDRCIELHVEKVLPCNWKAAQEAFIEAYHVLETHPEAIPAVGDANAQYDVFDENVNRFVQLRGFPSPHLKKELTQQQIVDAMGGGVRVPEGGSARTVFSEHLRQTMGEGWGSDLSKYSDAEMLYSIEYHLFPNMFVFPGISIGLIYRFRPNGNDPDTCIYDLIFTRPLPDSGERPEAPLPYRVEIDQSYQTVPGINPGLAYVFDQDTAIMEMQRKGMKASKKGALTLGNYQEVRVRAIHKTLDKYLNA
jgi:phenylpropionate dioxygenase-like ring-hydroxylating dioxygenase large terminal subunit